MMKPPGPTRCTAVMAFVNSITYINNNNNMSLLLVINEVRSSTDEEIEFANL